MPEALQPADLLSLNQTLITGGVKPFYAALEARGYCYPGWAQGVASSMGMAAIASADYLRGTALMGISSPIFRILSGAQVDKLRCDIARSYLRLLQRQSREEPDGVIRRDVNADEVWKLHGEGLERNGLGIENWNLYFPLAILKRLAGNDAAEQFWTFLRDARRRPSHIGILANLATIAFMYKQTMAGDIKCRQMAMAWLSRNPSMVACDDIERKLDASLRKVDRASQADLVAFLEVLDLEAHGLVQEGEAPAPGGRVALSRNLQPTAADPEPDPASAAVYRALLKRLTS